VTQKEQALEEQAQQEQEEEQQPEEEEEEQQEEETESEGVEPAKTFTATADSKGVVTFDGNASGVITAEWNDDHVTFTRDSFPDTINSVTTAKISSDAIGTVDASGNQTGVNLDFSESSSTNLEVTGGTGDDTITGGSENDTLKGGGGKDTFNVTAGEDSIVDFTKSADSLNVSGTGVAVASGQFKAYAGASINDSDVVGVDDSKADANVSGFFETSTDVINAGVATYDGESASNAENFGMFFTAVTGANNLITTANNSGDDGTLLVEDNAGNTFFIAFKANQSAVSITDVASGTTAKASFAFTGSSAAIVAEDEASFTAMVAAVLDETAQDGVLASLDTDLSAYANLGTAADEDTLELVGVGITDGAFSVA
jgi:hypothetical protein